MQNYIDRLMYPGKQLIQVLYKTNRNYIIYQCSSHDRTYSEKNKPETFKKSFKANVETMKC